MSRSYSDDDWALITDSLDERTALFRRDSIDTNSLYMTPERNLRVRGNSLESINSFQFNKSSLPRVMSFEDCHNFEQGTLSPVHLPKSKLPTSSYPIMIKNIETKDEMNPCFDESNFISSFSIATFQREETSLFNNLLHFFNDTMKKSFSLSIHPQYVDSRLFKNFEIVEILRSLPSKQVQIDLSTGDIEKIAYMALFRSDDCFWCELSQIITKDLQSAKFALELLKSMINTRISHMFYLENSCCLFDVGSGEDISVLARNTFSFKLYGLCFLERETKILSLIDTEKKNIINVIAIRNDEEIYFTVKGANELNSSCQPKSLFVNNLLLQHLEIELNRARLNIKLKNNIILAVAVDETIWENCRLLFFCEGKIENNNIELIANSVSSFAKILPSTVNVPLPNERFVEFMKSDSLYRVVPLKLNTDSKIFQESFFKPENFFKTFMLEKLLYMIVSFSSTFLLEKTLSLLLSLIKYLQEIDFSFNLVIDFCFFKTLRDKLILDRVTSLISFKAAKEIISLARVTLSASSKIDLSRWIEDLVLYAHLPQEELTTVLDEVFCLWKKDGLKHIVNALFWSREMLDLDKDQQRIFVSELKIVSIKYIEYTYGSHEVLLKETFFFLLSSLVCRQDKRSSDLEFIFWVLENLVLHHERNCTRQGLLNEPNAIYLVVQRSSSFWYALHQGFQMRNMKVRLSLLRLLATVFLLFPLPVSKTDHKTYKLFKSCLVKGIQTSVKHLGWCAQCQEVFKIYFESMDKIYFVCELLYIQLKCLLIIQDTRFKEDELTNHLVLLLKHKERVVLLARVTEQFPDYLQILITFIFRFFSNKELKNRIFEVLALALHSQLEDKITSTITQAQKPRYFLEAEHYISTDKQNLIASKAVVSLLVSLVRQIHFAQRETSLVVETSNRLDILFNILISMVYLTNHNTIYRTSIGSQVVKFGLYQLLHTFKEGVISFKDIPSLPSLLELYNELSIDKNTSLVSTTFRLNRVSSRRLGLRSLPLLLRKKLRKHDVTSLDFNKEEINAINYFIALFESEVDNLNLCQIERERHYFHIDLLIQAIKIKISSGDTDNVEQLSRKVNLYSTYFGSKGIPERKLNIQNEEFSYDFKRESLSVASNFDTIEVPVTEFTLLSNILRSSNVKDTLLSPLLVAISDINQNVNKISRSSQKKVIPFLDILLVYIQAKTVVEVNVAMKTKINPEKHNFTEIDAEVRAFDETSIFEEYNFQLAEYNFGLKSSWKCWNYILKQLTLMGFIEQPLFIEVFDVEDKFCRKHFRFKKPRLQPKTREHSKRKLTLQTWDFLDDFSQGTFIPFKRNFIAKFEGMRKIPLKAIPTVIGITDDLVVLYISFNSHGRVKSITEHTQGSLESFKIEDVREAFKRRIQLRWTAIEIWLTNGTHYFIDFQHTHQLKEFVFLFTKLCRTKNILLQSLESNFLPNITSKWLTGNLSNFEYLMILNKYSGRTSQDLNQYFVLPWLFMPNYFDLPCEESLRDLSKPMGALTKQRFEKLQYKMNMMKDEDNGFTLGNIRILPFLYGTHYSTTMGVLHYLVREEPFTAYHKIIHDGRMDHGDRQFSSISDTLQSVLFNEADFKELVPEFFYNAHFLKESCLQEVSLPIQFSTSEEFILFNRMILESKAVTENLNSWIDLIFGVKQQHEDNLFHPFTYETSNQIYINATEREKESIRAQVELFGQTPSRLFSDLHPRKIIQSKLRINSLAINQSIKLEKKQFVQHQDGDISLLELIVLDFSMLTIVSKLKENLYHLVSLSQRDKLQVIKEIRLGQDVIESIPVKVSREVFALLLRKKEGYCLNVYKGSRLHSTFKIEISTKLISMMKVGKNLLLGSKEGEIFSFDVSALIKEIERVNKKKSLTESPVMIQRSFSTPSDIGMSSFMPMKTANFERKCLLKSKQAFTNKKNSMNTDTKQDTTNCKIKGIVSEMSSVSCILPINERYFVVLVDNNLTVRIFDIENMNLMTSISFEHKVKHLVCTKKGLFCVLLSHQQLIIFNSAGEEVYKTSIDSFVFMYTSSVLLNNIEIDVLLLMKKNGEMCFVNLDVFKFINFTITKSSIEDSTVYFKAYLHNNKVLLFGNKGIEQLHISPDYVVKQ